MVKNFQITPLQKVREKTGLTQFQVAMGCGMTQASISRMESLEQKPTPENATSISKFFKHQVSELELLFPDRYMTAPELQP